MNILHLLSQNHLTGAEVYAATLAEEQIRQKQTVHQISNGFYYPSKAQLKVLAVETKSKFEFFKNVIILRRYLIHHKIDVIHAHSRAASKLAYYARLGLKIGYVSSVHGRQHSSFSKRHFNQYGDFQIPVCENVFKHLIEDFNYSPRRLKIIRNAISELKFPFIERQNKSSDILSIAIVGRTTGPKAQRTEVFIREFSKLLEKNNRAYQFTLIGGSLEKPNPNVVTKTLMELTSDVYHQFDLVCGSGRVCMEALMAGVPTIAFGESVYCGLVTPENFGDVMPSNFGDIGASFEPPQFNEFMAEKDLENFLRVDLRKLSKMAYDQFGLSAVTAKIQRVYESSYFLRHYPKWIPVLMYHKIPEKDLQSQHKIFVNRRVFAKHLSFFKLRGFKTLTFNELAKFRKGELDWKTFPRRPLILTFDDGYKDNLDNANPLLKKYNFKSQIFLLAEKEINSNIWDHASSQNEAHEIVSGADRQKWRQSQFEIGSHGFSHQRLTQMTETQALDELKKSKLSLENELGQKINVYAFTYGDTNTRCAELAQMAGYDYAVNTDTGGLNLEEEPYSVFRVNIFPDESFWSLWKKTSTWYRHYYLKKRNK